VFVDGHAKTKTLKIRVLGRQKFLSRVEGTFSLELRGYPETVSNEHVTAAVDPVGETQQFLRDHGAPQDVVVPKGHQGIHCDFRSPVHDVVDRIWFLLISRAGAILLVFGRAPVRMWESGPS